jgi:lariat debranching enzyme
VFIGGNHEASNYMQELPYGGWVAKNIYYMGKTTTLTISFLSLGINTMYAMYALSEIISY